MIGHWNRIVGRIAGRLWFWAVLHGALAVLTALAALALAPFISDRISADLGADAVEDILSILASSMLAVATFSLSTMVAAFGATTRTATPRAARLLIEDRIAQNAVATFVGAFIFGLVGIVALRAGLYGSSGRLVLFGVTILVIVGVVVTFFRWIDYLFRLGRLGEVISKVETVARASLTNHFRDPFLGARPAAAPPRAPHPCSETRWGISNTSTSRPSTASPPGTEAGSTSPAGRVPSSIGSSRSDGAPGPPTRPRRKRSGRRSGSATRGRSARIRGSA
jgi:uncharacterized membrane protein